jgi:tetratricopeptide (TPR) repeat protein
VTEAPISSEPALRPRGKWRSRPRSVWTVILVLVAAAAAAGVVAFWIYTANRTDRRFEVALAALDRGELDVAGRYARELKSSEGRRQQATFLRGAVLLKKGYYYPALDDLEKVKDEPGLQQAARTLIGQAWYHLGRHVEAQAALKEALLGDPDAVDAHRWLAASYYDLGAIHDALVHLQRTAHLDPADHRPHRLLGLIYKDYERYADAIPQYEESLRRKSDQPDWIDVREEMATCQLKLRRYQDALATLSTCPDSSQVHVIRAECHHALGQTALAKEALARALESKPDNLDARVLQGTMLLEEGDTQRAIEVFSRATAANPKDYTAHFKLAQAYAQSGQPELAEVEQKTADQIRQVRQEFSELHQAAWDNPRDMGVRLRLAQLAKELGRPDLEEVWLKSAAALQPLSTSKP